MDAFLSSLNELFVKTYRSIVKVEEVMLRDLSRSSLSISEMHLLESIDVAGPEGRTVTDIALDLDVSKPSVTVAIKRLEKKGYVTKHRLGQDGRFIHVRLTREGQRAATAHRYFHRQMVRAVAKTMDAHEKEVVVSALEKLNAFLTTQIDAAEHKSHNPEGDDCV